MTARDVAYDTLRAVDEDDAYANLYLPTAITRARLDSADAGLATELTYGTLRWQGTYDAIIAEAAGRDVFAIDPPVLDALRLGAHQLLATRIPPHAAVNETVSLVRDTSGRGASGFANAVLRKVTAHTLAQWQEIITEHARSDDERLGLIYSHPVWVIRAYRRALAAVGASEDLEALLGANNVSPTVSMAALPGLYEIPDGANLTPFSPLGYVLPGGDPARQISAAKGRVRVQDEGSQLAALALTRIAPVTAGERWLDLCAGPGGKTAILAAEALAGGAHLDANEIVPTRAALVRRSIAGVPLDVTVSERDGRDLAEHTGPVYDRILVDAPCTGLGAFRRRPESRWRKSARDIPDLSALQRDLLSAAWRALRPGGVVAYVTCSPHLAETSSVVTDILKDAAGKLTECDARAVLEDISRTPLSISAQQDGSLRAQLWPHRHGTDAMSITLLRRV